jgi:hypothetical protein
MNDLSPYSNDAIPVAIVGRSWHAQSLPMSHCGMSEPGKYDAKGFVLHLIALLFWDLFAPP